jgi:hypothetical protein
MEIHEMSGKHEFRTGQVDDEEILMHRRQPEIRLKK